MRASESDGADAWIEVLEKLIVGISHHISNRVATLAGVSDILAGSPTAPPIVQALSDEVPKLEEAVRLLRLLAAPNELEEAVTPIQLVEGAIALAKLHPDLKEGVYTTHGGSEVPPVFVRPVRVTHEILVAITKASLESADGAVCVRLLVDGEVVVIEADRHIVKARSLMAARLADARSA